MVDTHAAGCQFNTPSPFRPLPTAFVTHGSFPHGEARAVLLAFLRSPGDVCPIDPVLEAIERHLPDPYEAIVSAVTEGLIVAEFGAPAPGATLRSVVLRKL